MKRLLASLLTVGALAACGSPLAKPETPQQALDAAAQRDSQLKSAKFDLQGTVDITFPPQMQQSFGANGLANGTMNMTLSGSGELQFPDRMQSLMTLKVQGMTLTLDTVVAGGKSYFKNPLTEKWQVLPASQSLSAQMGDADPLSFNQFLQNVASIKDLGDTSLDGTTVHHYQLVPDKSKMLARIDSSKNPQAAAELKQVLDSGSITIEVWFGVSDHLVRRMTMNMNYAVDVNSLSGGTYKGIWPAGTKLQATASILMNFHDFDAPVTIAIPAVG